MPDIVSGEQAYFEAMVKRDLRAARPMEAVTVCVEISVKGAQQFARQMAAMDKAVRATEKSLADFRRLAEQVEGWGRNGGTTTIAELKRMQNLSRM